MENIPLELPKVLRLKGRTATLFLNIGASLLLAAFTVFIIIFAGGSLSSRIVVYVVAACFVALIVWAALDAIRLFSIRVELREDGFTYHAFPKGDREYSYSDCESWRPNYRYRHSADNRAIELFMNDGSKLLVDNAIIKDGLGVRIGYYDGLPQKDA